MTAPHDVWAERSLIGLALTHPESTRDVFLGLRAGDWFQSAHADVAAVVAEMFRDGIPVSAVTVHGELARRGRNVVTDQWLTEVAQEAWQPETAPRLAETVKRHAVSRTLIRSLREALGALESPDTAADVRAITGQLRGGLDRAESGVTVAATAGPTPLGEFLAVEDRYNWLVPGVLERGERLVLTGGEGGGKSVLISQMAATIAGGLHPFTADVMANKSARVLVIDCENSAAQSRRRYRWITRKVDQARTQAGAEPVRWSERIAIEMRPAGIDLCNANDAAWLEHHVSAWEPDVLVLGPLYKLHHQDPSSETAAREIAWIIDQLRERHGFALFTEAHSGNGTDMSGRRNMRPIGSSLWRRWSEYGFGLAPSDGKPVVNGRARQVDVVAWRGAREERCWPVSFRWGEMLPWWPDDEYFDRASEWSNK
ncbi:AAA family ATPase [Nocardia brasiliensis]|uniref:AAA family ATPase n=1 Tax=Nocardia brasiliensis TaxID=37326 RepID=UPI0024554BB1|nr:AAA family ATPase [Nocardia brasiliensis]